MHCGAEVTESSTNKQHHLYRAMEQMGNQVGSLACLVCVMVDTEPVAASTATLVENG